VGPAGIVAGVLLTLAANDTDGLWSSCCQYPGRSETPHVLDVLSPVPTGS
jgi:hypothetical protein